MTLLNILYDQLDFKSGSLCTATDKPLSVQNSIDWLEKGEWLSAAKRIGAEKIFFVENNPVAVFIECETALEKKVKAFNKAWCLARPRLLFLAAPGEITVYDLAQKPIDIKNKKAWNNLSALAPPFSLHDLTKVSRKLQIFHRDNVESGRLFADRRFGDLKNRADKALIRDLKMVRRELIYAGLSGKRIRFAHALIGRSIFIRYLEDRRILTEEYFLRVARQKAGWTDLLRNPVSRAGLDFSDHETFFPRVLQDKTFTYSLFKKLARDFNGDMFPDVDEEEKAVAQKHLMLIQSLLYGDVGIQKKLFFYSYRFDIIPLDLISSIYEEFYHGTVSDDKKKSKVRQDGAYYTPPVLAEFVLSRVLTPDVLKKSPRIMDPACGSGIFLVEAFRRIVRYEWYKKKQPPAFDELKDILKEQIAGIEANDEAARITAFSLYLSMLHYLDPPAIDRQIKMGNRLPNLIASKIRSTNHLHCILPKNAFDVEHIESNPVWKERFGRGCTDVVVGNPPWGAPGNKADVETKARQKILLNWCKSNNKPIGDKEPSQAFLWRALDFLRTNGKAGMLVSAGVLFKHSTTTQQFRKQWLDSVRLEEVFNFVHVRKFFFKGADSPFVSICFSKAKQKDMPVYYWTAKQSTSFNKNQSILLSRHDLNIITDHDLADYKIWKSLWWGRFIDKQFIDYLNIFPKLSSCIDIDKSARGFQEGNRKSMADWLGKYQELPINRINRYVPFSDQWLVSAPDHVESRGKTEFLYSGDRILVKRGIEQNNSPKGQIISQFYKETFCFRNSAHCIKLINSNQNAYKLLIGILWSSLARYFYFLTSSNWGLWHYEIHLEEIFAFPVKLNENNNKNKKKVISIVDKLRNYRPQKQDLFHRDGVPEETIKAERRKWEAELDEAVFDLYGLNEEQKDLIRDLCEVTLPFFYRPFDSIGAMQAVENNDLSWIEKYVHIFGRRWNAYLDNDEEMRAEVHLGAHNNMVAIEFYPADKGDSWNLKSKNDSWGYILEQLGNTLPQPMGTSQIVLDGLVHVVSDSGIIIIKRNEKRFWTRSLAREDADATICKAMQMHLNRKKD